MSDLGPTNFLSPDISVFHPNGIVDATRPDVTDPRMSTQDMVYSTYAGVDITATLVLPNESPVNMGELQTISYSIHRENTPVRCLGHVSPTGFVKGPRTVAGSMIFTTFNTYAFYRLAQFQTALNDNLYPLADMLPPFDVVLSFSNETGSFSKLKILGVTIIDEGGTMSIDDLITEQTFSYMARGIQPMTRYLPEQFKPDPNALAETSPMRTTLRLV